MATNKPSYIPSSLRNKSKDFPYIGGSIDIYDEVKNKHQQQINADVDETLELHQSEINALDSQNYETYTAEDGDTLSDILPPEGEVDTVYRVGNWDGKQEVYDPTVYSEYGWDANNGVYRLLDVKEYTLATAQDFINPDATKKAKVPTVGAVSEVFGHYEENPEFKQVLLDAEGRIVEAVRADGSKLYGAGVVVRGKAYFGKGAFINGEIDTSILVVKSVDNPEFYRVFLDNNDRILIGVQRNGNIYFGCGVPRQIKEYIEKSIKDFYIYNPEYIQATTDKAERIIEAIKKDGTKVIGGNTEIGGNLSVNGSKFETIDIPEYLQALTDQNNRLVEGVEKDGTKYIGSRLSVKGHIAENAKSPEFMQAMTDNNGKIIEGRRFNGTKVEYCDVEYPNGIPNQIKQYINDHSGSASAIRVLNPYSSISSKLRKRTMTHEHVTSQSKFEELINRGIDIPAISNYSPGVPLVPASGWSREYEDWKIKLDGSNNVVYETDGHGNIKTKTVGGVTYKIPVLEKVTKTLTGSFSDFIKEDGNVCDVANLPQLPNAEHTHYYFPEGNTLTSTKHLNFVGCNWNDAVNGDGSIEGLAEYNSENDLSLTGLQFETLFPMYSLPEIFDKVRDNLMFRGKVFGTINHPGFSGLSNPYPYADYYMNMAPDLFKAVEVYNNGDTAEQAAMDIEFYDRCLMRGWRLWCTAVNDWGRGTWGDPNYPENSGCCLLYLDGIYDSMSPSEKSEMALDALISGSFSACGYGTLDISSVNVNGGTVQVTFNQVPDSTIVDIDGVRVSAGAKQTLEVEVDKSNTFVRFEAYKDDDFIFTQPFFIEK